MHLYIYDFNNNEDGRLKEVRDVLFQNSLKDYLARTGQDDKNTDIDHNEHGKPFFPHKKNAHFSISHSGKFWICMFHNQNVGIDVEDSSNRKLTNKRLDGILSRFFTDDEKEYVLSGIEFEKSEDDLDPAVKERFFKIWTAKESYMKFTGNGFSQGINSFSTLSDDLDVYFRKVPIDPVAVVTYCTKEDTKLDAIINL